MRVLVTGASGFVGSTLCDELTKQGHEVTVLVRKTSKLRNLAHAKFSSVEGDLRDAASLKNAVEHAEVIFHVAGVIAAVSREEFFASNVQGTENLGKAALQYGKSLQRFVYVSSLAAGGPAAPGGKRLETDAPAPVSFYGESKLAGEEVLAKLDLPTVVIRPPAVYGPRDRGLFTFFTLIQKGILPLLGMQKPDPRHYSFVHVDDLVQGILLAGFSSAKMAKNEIFYICGDGEYTWTEAMMMIAEGMEKRTFTVHIPILALRMVAAFSTGLSKITGKTYSVSLDKMQELEALAWTCSNEKAKSRLGFKPYWDFKRGAQQTARWYREQAWL